MRSSVDQSSLPSARQARECRPTRWVGAVVARAIALSFGTVPMTLGLVAAASASASAAPIWVAPVQPAHVLARFAPPVQRWQAGHRGVDLAATGAVRAAGSGVVVFAGRVGGRSVITVSHGRLRTTYEPVEAAVEVGQSVTAGQLLGAIGSGGHCSRRCLHWGLLAGDDYLDPLLLITSGPPVLKALPAPEVSSLRATNTTPRRDNASTTGTWPSATATAGRTAAPTAAPEPDVAALPSSGDARTLPVRSGILVATGVAGAAVAVARRRRRRS